MRTFKPEKVLFLTAAIAFLLSGLAMGQGITGMKVDANGNVGIGVNPTTRLEVAQDEAIKLGNAYVSSGTYNGTYDFAHFGFNAWYSSNDTGDWHIPDNYKKSAVLQLGDDGMIAFHQTQTAGWPPTWVARLVIDPYGMVGIGTASPGYPLDVIGDVHLTGKLTSDGGNDPPYVLYNYETRQSIVARVSEEVPPDKLEGAVVFFNGETSKMEIFLATKGEFRDLDGKLLASVDPITETFEVEDQYYFDQKTGKVKKYKVRKVPGARYRMKYDYKLDEKTGEFYRIVRDENGVETGKVKVPREEAVEAGS